jgi:hypothetical protein
VDARMSKIDNQNRTNGACHGKDAVAVCVGEAGGRDSTKTKRTDHETRRIGAGPQATYFTAPQLVIHSSSRNYRPDCPRSKIPWVTS